MQEKDIKRKLNQELDEMAPDILNKILAQPIERIESEKELFGKDKPLFKEKKNFRQYMFAPAITAIAACFVMVIFFLQSNGVKTNVAFSIVVDVNPSITIEVDEDGAVEKIVAGNKDAKEIVDNINKNLDDDASYEKILSEIVDELNEAGYLKKKDKAMLFSVVADDEESGKSKVADVKENTEKYTKENDIKCKPVYQSCVVTEEIERVAKKNNVSVGKAAFALKVAEKEKTNVDELCNETVDVLVEHAESSGITVGNVVTEETTATGEALGEPITNSVPETTDEDVTDEAISGDVEETTTEVEETTTISPEEQTTPSQGYILPQEPATTNQQLVP